jgi:Xaa-Pro aminopeptidase
VGTVIADAGCGEYVIHRTGDGIALTMHEPTYIVGGETSKLEHGMCFWIESGVYLRRSTVCASRTSSPSRRTAAGGSTQRELRIMA